MKTNKLSMMLKHTKKTSLCLYAISFVLLVMAGVRASGIAGEAVRKARMDSAYSYYDLYNDFISHDYGRLCEKVYANNAIGAVPDSEEQQLYDFAACYNAAVDYHMYLKNGMNEAANACKADFAEHESRITRRIILDALADIKSVYGIS